MAISTTITFACDASGCSTTLQGSLAQAAAAGWAWSNANYAVDAQPTPMLLCPTHAK